MPWGVIKEIVTDNETAFVAALGNRESTIKACKGNTSKWPSVAPYASWADRATARERRVNGSLGHSPFCMAHGIQPVLPFDITLAMFLMPNLADKLSTVDLITTVHGSSKCAKTISRRFTQTYESAYRTSPVHTS